MVDVKFPPMPSTLTSFPEDTFFRKAQTARPGGSIIEREWSASEKYQLYARGFRDGAGTKPMRKDHMGLGPYDRGYTDGVSATRTACSEEAKRLDYEPSILRPASSGSVAK